MFKINDKPVNLEYREYPLNEKFPIYALLNGEFPFRPVSDTEPAFLHFHNCIEIGIVHEGSYDFYIEKECLTLSKGDVFLILPYTMHISLPKNKEEGGFCEYLYFLPEKLLNNFFPEKIPDSLLPFHYENLPVIFSREQYPAIHQTVSSLLKELRGKDTNYRVYVNGLFLTLMAELSRTLPGDSKRNSSQNKILPLLLPALQYIDRHYASELSIDKLAAICHISPSHFHKLFKQSMTQSPTHYIQNVRLVHACGLLRSTEDSILTIALSVGFQSVANFNRLFQKLYQQTPSQWRNERRSVQKKDVRHSVFPIPPQNPPTP